MGILQAMLIAVAVTNSYPLLVAVGLPFMAHICAPSRLAAFITSTLCIPIPRACGHGQALSLFFFLLPRHLVTSLASLPSALSLISVAPGRAGRCSQWLSRHPPGMRDQTASGGKLDEFILLALFQLSVSMKQVTPN